MAVSHPMIEFLTGDILRVEAEALVNTVNCVGIMGRGVALQFKKAFPENFKAYVAACERQDVRPGRMFVFETGYVGNPKFIINFPTKRHWRGKSRMEDIESGLLALADVIRERNIRSIALPPLGSGLGGLNWPDVRRRIEALAEQLPSVTFAVFEPRTDRDDALASPAGPPARMTAGRAALIELMQRYLAGLLDPFVTLLEVHKLMYFMQEAGEPLALRYVKGPYGPYAENLRHVLKAIDGHFVSGYGEGGEAPGKELNIVPGAAEDARAFLAGNADAQARLARVANLVEGFETPFGLELLATVHWLTRHEGVEQPELVEAVHAWGAQKQQFTTRQIELAAGVLAAKGWS